MYRRITFRSPSGEQERKDLIQWIRENCPFFYGFPFPSDLKIKISEPSIVERIPLITIEMGCLHTQFFDFYIVKRGNAFSCITKVGLGYPHSPKMKSAEEIKKRAAVFEIFSKGDVIILGITILFPYFNWNALELGDYSSIGKENIYAGLPFGKSIWPLEIIKIEQEEIERIFSGKKVEFSTFRLLHDSLYQYTYHQLLFYKWRLAAQLNTTAEVKIFSVLYLCFLGQIPLKWWIAKGKEINCGEDPEKPRKYVDSFRIGRKELALLSGLNPRSVDEILNGKIVLDKRKKKNINIKSIFETDSVLTKFIKCKRLLNGDYEFSSTSRDSLYLLEKRILVAPRKSAI